MKTQNDGFHIILEGLVVLVILLAALMFGVAAVGGAIWYVVIVALPYKQFCHLFFWFWF